MPRKFNIGRHNEVLMNDEHYNIYKVLQHYLEHPNDLVNGPGATTSDPEIINGALWLDRFTDPSTADLKYFDNGKWNLLFADRFELLAHLLDPNEPINPIEGMLWINQSGVLCYYHNGQFIPIKAAEISDSVENMQFEDFLIINPLKPAEYTVVNNFSKFLFSRTPIKEWTAGEHYYYQQAVTVKGTIYICIREHDSDQSNYPLIGPFYWVRLDMLLQFLVPNSNYDKIFCNGLYLHEKLDKVDLKELEEDLLSNIGITFDYEYKDIIHTSLRYDVENDLGLYDTATLEIKDFTMDPDFNPYLPSDKSKEIEGYIKNTNVSVYIPIQDIEIDNEDLQEYKTDNEYKLITGVHINPKRLNNIEKYFIKLDKDSLVVPIPKENTEFYGVGTRYQYLYTYIDNTTEEIIFNHKLTADEINKIIDKRKLDITNGKYNSNEEIKSITLDETYDGLGMLLIENSNDFIYDYSSYLYNGEKCIKVSKKVADTYDYIYAIHYTFSDNIKVPGTLERQRVNLSDQQSVFIGRVNINNIAVFAQGLYYEKDDNTYEYDYDSGYLSIKEKLMKDGTNNRLELSVLKFPYIYTGKITNDNYVASNYDTTRGYRIDLNAILFNPDKCLGFLAGIQINPKEVFDWYADDQTAIYFKDLTADYVRNHNGEINWAIAETDITKDGIVDFEMYRGRTKAIAINNKVGIKITRDKAAATNDTLFLNFLESPLFYVDGVLITQSDVTINEDNIIIKNASVGQDIIMLADKNSGAKLEDILEQSVVLSGIKSFDPNCALEDYDTHKKLVEDVQKYNEYLEKVNSYVYEDYRYIHNIYNFNKLLDINSDNLLYQDNALYVTLRTQPHNASIIYLRNGLICDVNSVEVNELSPTGYNGEIKHLISTTEDKWVVFNSKENKWSTLDSTEVDIIKKYSYGYMSNNNSLSIINDFKDQKYCTYFNYNFSDTVEKRLMTGYCYPDGNTGTKDGLLPFKLNYKHNYLPGRNELSIYLNGVKQQLSSPYDDDFNSSFATECKIGSDNSFLFAINDGSVNGQAINEYDGYYTYKYTDSIDNTKTRILYSKTELTASELTNYKDIELLSSPNKNEIFYVSEPTESGESKACNRYTLTYKDSLSSQGAYANNAYRNNNINLSNGNIRVFINGIRQPYGVYKDLDGNNYSAYKILDSKTIKIEDPLIGGMDDNLGDINNPQYPINKFTPNSFYEIIDQIEIEQRNDLTLREITIPFKPGQTEFTAKDGLPNSLFKSKDFIMIYINGLAYGNEYTNKYNTITLDYYDIQKYINSNNNVITFEWR